MTSKNLSRISTKLNPQNYRASVVRTNDGVQQNIKLKSIETVEEEGKIILEKLRDKLRNKLVRPKLQPQKPNLSDIRQSRSDSTLHSRDSIHNPDNRIEL